MAEGILEREKKFLQKVNPTILKCWVREFVLLYFSETLVDYLGGTAGKSEFYSRVSFLLKDRNFTEAVKDYDETLYYRINGLLARVMKDAGQEGD